MKKIISVLTVALILCSINLVACIGSHPPKPQYASQYTEEEQVYRITCETKHRYEEVLNSGDMLTFSAYILYTFDNFPEYFLIEFTWKNYEAFCNYHTTFGFDLDYLENVPSNETYYSHIIGYVKNDCYYLGLNTYSSEKHGKSYYSESGAINNNSKLYHGYYIYAYKDGDTLIGCEYRGKRSEIELGQERIIENEEINNLIKRDRERYQIREDRLLVRKRRRELYE